MCLYPPKTLHLQFLLLIDVPIQNRAQQLQIYEIFSLPVPHSSLTVQYKINHTYIGVTYHETKAVAIKDLQYRTCEHANKEFCRKHAPFPSLTNWPLCVTSLYAKNDQVMKEQCSLVVSHMPHIFKLIAVVSDLWIIPSNPQTLGSEMTIICPDKASSTVPLH